MTRVPFPEYVNVRIRSRFRGLISRETYEDLITGDNLGGLATFLLDRDGYSRTVEQALQDFPEREGLERGVADYFTESVYDIIHMADERLGCEFEQSIHQFDIRNLKVLLLSRHHRLEFARVSEMIVPCGALDRKRLRVLYGAKDIPEMVAMLKKWYPLGADALGSAFRKGNDSESIVKLLNRVEQNMYRLLLSGLRPMNEDESVLINVVKLEIDMKNILAALKYVWAGINERDNQPDIFIKGGNISSHQLYEMIQTADLDDVFEMIESTPFHEAVEKGIIYYAETGFLNDMEHFFEDVFIQRTQRYRKYQPFGIGVFIGYLWAQYVELTNLRTIINGIAFRSGPGQIKKGLIYV